MTSECSWTLVLLSWFIPFHPPAILHPCACYYCILDYSLFKVGNPLITSELWAKKDNIWVWHMHAIMKIAQIGWQNLLISFRTFDTWEMFFLLEKKNLFKRLHIVFIVPFTCFLGGKRLNSCSWPGDISFIFDTNLNVNYWLS